ncbi:MAG TPA: hypothetical protein VFT04_00175, partial [Gemmatimonadales bacterium]|nr:hypothetical protein [Gemmatimonadales bacterium]
FIAWVVFSVVRSAAKAAGELEKKQRPPVGPLPKSLPGMNPDFLEMLRQLERASRGAGGAPEPHPVPASGPRRLPAPAPAEEPEFVEDVKSLEVVVRRAEREEVSLDSASELAARRRRETAARRERPRTEADHAAFDARIRAEPDATAVEAPKLEGAQRLRHALIWNELLGPPVSLRDDRDATSR